MSVTVTTPNTTEHRYCRQMALPHVGLVGQEKLHNARVLCVGAGGLGSPALLYLAAAGVGTLGIVDDDHVALSNLQRQILYNETTLQQPKVTAAQQCLHALNSDITVHPYPERLTPENAATLIRDYDIIVDGSDNLRTRYLINDHCHALQKPWVFASVDQFAGQCSLITPGSTCYRCLFPESPQATPRPNCNQQGVIGVVPGFLGVLQANEVIKWILGQGVHLTNILLQVDLLQLRFDRYPLQPDPHCRTCSQHHPTHTTAPSENAPSNTAPVPEINATQLHALITAQKAHNQPLCLLDVRAPHEHTITPSLPNSTCIPLAQLPDHLHTLDPHRTTVTYCAAGVRSYHAAQWLQAQGFTDVMSLKMYLGSPPTDTFLPARIPPS